MPVLGRMLSRRAASNLRAKPGEAAPLPLAGVLCRWYRCAQPRARVWRRFYRFCGSAWTFPRARRSVSRSSGSCTWRGKQRICCATARGRFKKGSAPTWSPRTSSKPALFWTASPAATPPKPSSTPSSPTSASESEAAVPPASAFGGMYTHPSPTSRGLGCFVSFLMGRTCVQTAASPRAGTCRLRRLGRQGDGGHGGSALPPTAGLTYIWASPCSACGEARAPCGSWASQSTRRTAS